MPVYLCRPGHASSEPWRHGVQVYAYPFRIDGSTAAAAAAGSAEAVAGAGPPPGAATASAAATAGAGTVPGSTSEASSTAAIISPEGAAGGGHQRGGTSTNVPVFANPLLRNRRQSASTSGTIGTPATSGTGAPALSEPSHAAAAVASAAQLSGANQQQQQQQPSVYAEVTHRAASAGVGVAVRRVRHAEVVLADEVSASYGRYWLRLRWPGPRGGVAGYIALGVVPSAVGADDRNAKSVGVGAANNDAGTDLANSASSAGTGTSMAGALSGEREFRYRTLMSGELEKEKYHTQMHTYVP